MAEHKFLPGSAIHQVTKSQTGNVVQYVWFNSLEGVVLQVTPLLDLGVLKLLRSVRVPPCG